MMAPSWRVSSLLVLAAVACSSGGGGTADVPVSRDVFIIPAKDVPFTVDITYDTGVPADPGPASDGVTPADTTAVTPDATDVPAAEVPSTEGVVTPDPGPDACVPKCQDKNCGSDGCGGKCGPDCVSPWFCSVGKCSCITKCTELSLECGDDGCGGKCKEPVSPCDVCSPKGRCMTGTCNLADSSPSCADGGLSGNTGMPTNGNRMALYDSCSGNMYWGPEKSYKFVATGSGVVTMDFSSANKDARIFLLEDAGDGCNAKDCLAVSDGVLSREVTAGKTYYVVVDSLDWDDNVYFSFSFDCSWYVPPVDK